MTTIQDAGAEALRGRADEDGTAELAFWRERAAQLQRALDTRVVIEQAKGVLAERLGCDVNAAFEVLRHAARNTRTSVHELAAQVVAQPVTPQPIASAYRTRRLRREAV
jgi:hypothetical protein